MKVKEILKWRPCCKARPLIEQHAEEEFTAIDVLTTPLLDGHDDWRLWVVLREAVIDAKTLRIFGCDCAERALRRDKITDERCWNAIEVSRKYACGEATNLELAASWKLANAATHDVLVGHVDSAYAAAASAYADVTDAVRAAAFACPLGYVKQTWQVKHLVELLQKKVGQK